MSRQGPSEGVVRLGSAGGGAAAREVLVCGRAALNRAMHGDTVAGVPRGPLSSSCKVSWCVALGV